MTSHGAHRAHPLPATPPVDERPTPADELRHDRRRERWLLWKGLISLLVVVAVVWVRQRYLL